MRHTATVLMTRQHHFTVDVEEYFQVSAFEGRVDPEDWDSYESRVGRGVATLLEALDDADARATFFVLGWVADRHPSLVRQIAAAGHEVASHGWRHARVTRQDPEEFREDVRRSKAVLEDLVGASVDGYRAPSFSIVPGREWALDILIEEGYAYDSSLFPVRRRGYGYPSARPEPHRIARPSGSIMEFPPTTLRFAGFELPAAGGAYFRLLPYGLVQRALLAAERDGVSGTFYIHPWELDADQPRMAVPWATALRHYGGLARTRERLARLLREFSFTAIEESVGSTRPSVRTT